jgi:RND family efflux transporter MFP subunit
MKRSTIVGSLVVAGLTAAFGVRIAAHQSKAAEPEKADVAVSSVEAERPKLAAIQDVVRFSGVVRPRNEVEVSAKVGGRVEEFSAELGQEVKRGQVLAVIEHVELGLQSEQAKAQVEVAQAQVLGAEVQLKAAITQQQRIATLQTGGAVAQSQRDQAELALRSAQASLQAAQAHVKLAQAASGLATRAVRNSFVTSPIAGVVVRKNVSLGVQVNPGQPLLQVQDVAQLKVRGTVNARDFLRIAIGQSVDIVVDEYSAEPIKGRIESASPALDPATRRAAIEVAIDNPERRLLSNSFANATIKVGEHKSVLSVPASSVVTLPTGRFLYVLRGDRAKALAIPTDVAADGERISVEGTLSDSDLVVTQGQASLTDGQTVQVRQEQSK